MRGYCQRQQSRQPHTTACLVTLLSGSRVSMAAAGAYTSSRSSRMPSSVVGFVPAFAARLSSSCFENRDSGNSEMGSRRSPLVIVELPGRSRGGGCGRGLPTAMSMSVERWNRGGQKQPWKMRSAGGVCSLTSLGGRGWPAVHRSGRSRSLAASAATASSGGCFDSAELLKMSYRDLQKLAKENHVRANQTGKAIISDLVALGASSDGPHPGSGEDIVIPGAMLEESSDWVSAARDKDIMAAVDLDDDDDDESSPDYAQAVKKATPGKFTVADMEGLRGGIDKGDGWVTFKLGDEDALDLERMMGDDFDDDEDDDEEEGDADDSMDARLRDAVASKPRLSPEMLASRAEDFGFDRDTPALEKLAITVPKGCCPGCGSRFQSRDPDSPGFLQSEKLEDLLGKGGGGGGGPVHATLAEGAAATGWSEENEADMDPEAWLDAQPDINTDLDFDLGLVDGYSDGGADEEWVEGAYTSPKTASAGGGGGGGLGRAARDTASLTGRQLAGDAAELSLEDVGAGWGVPGATAGAEEEEEEEEKLVVCQRCFRLRNYGSVEDKLRPGFSDSDLLTPQRFLELVGSIRKKRCLIIYLVDLFDFHGTFLYNLPRVIGNNPVLVAGNKVDLLPRDLKRQRVTKWVRDRCRESGLPELEMRDVHLVSCKHGLGIAPLMRQAREQALREDRDIYVLGAANVGKSTFINYVIKDRGNNGGGSARPKRDAKGATAVAGRGVTVSNVPGTTLDFLKVDLGDKRALYDTPGLLLPHTLTSRLNAEELRAAIPKKTVDHVTFRLGEGKVVLVGGLARVEVVTGRPFLLTFFVSNDVRLHPTDTKRVDDMLSQHVGKGQMIFPPFEPGRLQDLGALVPTDFDIVGAGWRESAADVVIAGLGWVSVTGAGPLTLRVWTPPGVLVMAREPLLPYESWETTAKFTGGGTVKKGKKKQGRRA